MFADTCPWCREPILPGEPVGVSDGDRMHLACVAEEMDDAFFDRDMGFD